MSYSDWPVEAVSPLIVLLDDENPRIDAEGEDQSRIRELLLENERITDLAREISSSGGLFPHDTIIVTKEGAGYRVLEGNRRIAALQLLLNRKLLPEEYEAVFPVADDNLKSEISEVRVVVSPNREASDKIIAQIHAFSARKKWSALANYRFAYKKMQKAGSLQAIANALGVKAPEIRKYIRRYEIYKLAISLDWNDQERAILEGEDIPITALVYPFENNSVKSLIGPVFDDKGTVQPEYDLDIVKAALKKLARDSLLPLTSTGKPKLTTRGAGSQSIKSYFADEHGPMIAHWQAIIGQTQQTQSQPSPNPPKQEGPSSNAPTAKPGDKTAKPKSQKPKDFFEDFAVPAGTGQRLEALTYEISRIDYKRFPISAGMLLRSLLEEVLTLHLKANGIEASYKKQIGASQRTLKSLILYLSDTKNNAFKDVKIAQQLAKFQNSGVKSDLDQIVHSQWGVVSKEALLTIRPYVRPIIETIIFEEW